MSLNNSDEINYKKKYLKYKQKYLNLKNQIGHGKLSSEEKKYPNGDFYIGTFLKKEKTGQGKMTYANGNIYEGTWKYDKKNGLGKMKYVSGNIYEGNWQNDEKNGQGKMTYANGEIFEGTWRNGIPLGWKGQGQDKKKSKSVYKSLMKKINKFFTAGTILNDTI